jgi:hypothetical protein
MSYLVQKFAKNMTWYLLFAAVVGTMKDLILQSSEVAAIAVFGAVYFVLVGWLWYTISVLPFGLLAIIYYSELRRLRLVLKDFLFLMQKSPFAFDTVAEAYFEMKEDFGDVQNRLGSITGLMTGVMFLKMVETIIVVLYNGRSGIYSPPPEAAYDGDIIFYGYVSTVCSTLTIFPVILVMAYSNIAINERMGDIEDTCVALLSTSAEAPPDDSEEGPLVSPDVEAGAPVVASVATSVALNSINVMKFTAIIEKRPCEITLCGYKFTKQDVGGTLAIVVFVLAVNLLGLNNFLG